MKVRYIGEGSLRSNGITFNKNIWITISKSVFSYLKRTYPNSFEFDEEVKQKIVEPEEKKETKKPLRKRIVKKAE